MKNINKPLTPLPPEQIAADALNEQGYLFQHKVATVLLAHEKNKKPEHQWQLEAAELPVSLSGGHETRIDLVLRHGHEKQPLVRAVVECKRSAREFKRWIFFAQSEIAGTPLPGCYYAERAHLYGSFDGRGVPNIVHTVEARPATPDCLVFDFGVEAKLNRSSNDKRVSATNAIEDAFQQATLGQAGLGVQLRKAHTFNFRILPVVVTTAKLMSAHFDTRHVTLDRGEIEVKNIKVESRKWLAVNFRISQTISQCVPMNLHNKIPITAELRMRQVRTVFVVQAEHIHEFLAWLGQLYPSATN